MKDTLLTALGIVIVVICLGFLTVFLIELAKSGGRLL